MRRGFCIAIVFFWGCSSTPRQSDPPQDGQGDVHAAFGSSQGMDLDEKSRVPLQGIVNVSFTPESAPSQIQPYYTIKVAARHYEVMIPHLPVYDLIPRVRTQPEYRHPAMLLQEYQRFGIFLDKEENHFRVEPRGEAGKGGTPVPDIHRIRLSNNSLSPGKWELVFYTKESSDASTKPAHQPAQQGRRYRPLGHHAFNVDRVFYKALFQGKNKISGEELLLPYDSLSNRGEQVILPLEKWRAGEEAIESEVVEWGHHSNLRIEDPGSREAVKRGTAVRSYKNAYGRIQNGHLYRTYADVLKHPVQFAPFREHGFYLPDSTILFDYSWMKGLDRIGLSLHPREPRGRYLNLTLDGAESPYAIHLLDFDLAKISHGEPVEVAFGADAYPKMRKYRKEGYSNTYHLPPGDGTNLPQLWLVDTATGSWINNQLRGLEKLILQWESSRQDVLRVYLVSYERLLPVFFARIKVTDSRFKKTRIHNVRYEPDKDNLIAAKDSILIRMERENLMAKYYGDSHKAAKVTLNFEALKEKDEKLHDRGYVYFEKGFLLYGRAFMRAHPFYSLGPRGYPEVPSTALVNGNVPGINLLKPHNKKASGGQAEKGPYFDALSIDMGLFSPSASRQVVLVGVRWDESVVDLTLELEPFPKMKTFKLEGLEDLSELRWLSQSVVMDNIVLVKKGGLDKVKGMTASQ